MSSTRTTNHDADTTSTVTSRVWSAELRVVTTIDATPDDVWRVLGATDRFPDWNPFITSLEGPLVVGGGITVVLCVSGRKPQTLRPKIIELENGRTLGWHGRVGVRGLLDAWHHLTIEPVDHRHCRFVQHERFAGVLVPAFRKLLTVDTPAAFVAMNSALVQRVAACA